MLSSTKFAAPEPPLSACALPAASLQRVKNEATVDPSTARRMAEVPVWRELRQRNDTFTGRDVRQGARRYPNTVVRDGLATRRTHKRLRNLTPLPSPYRLPIGRGEIANQKAPLPLGRGLG